MDSQLEREVRHLLKLHGKGEVKEHQIEGVLQLITDTDADRGRVVPKVFFLFDEVGCGKTKQCIDASQILYEGIPGLVPRRSIDTVLVVTPGFARSTWAEEDPLLGQVAMFAWDATPNVIHEYHKHYTDLFFDPPDALHWVVTNYEFIRRDERLFDLIKVLRGRRTWMILDESWALKGNSAQMKACRRLRNKRVDRVTLLNGTPLADGEPEDMFYPLTLADPNILGLTSRTQFRAKYCVMGGYLNKQVVDHTNLDDFNAKVAPYILARRTREQWDLPPMLDPILVEARLSNETWSLYKDMRDDLTAFLGNQVSVSRQAITKTLRLAQITSGFLGGLEDFDTEDDVAAFTAAPAPQWLRKVMGEGDEQEATTQSEVPQASAPPSQTHVSAGGTATFTREVGREKLDAFLNWMDTFPKLPERLLVWSRFSPELERTTLEMSKYYPEVRNLKGGQRPEERRLAKELLAPGTTRRGCVVGNQKAGGASLNFAGASVAVYLSNGPALIERTQSIGRIERPGATEPMLIVDVVATGPKGQKTIDHAILRALRSKDDMARWTVDQWRALLAELKNT